jgi:hypothetical protein
VIPGEPTLPVPTACERVQYVEIAKPAEALNWPSYAAVWPLSDVKQYNNNNQDALFPTPRALYYRVTAWCDRRRVSETEIFQFPRRLKRYKMLPLLARRPRALSPENSYRQRASPDEPTESNN